MGRGYLLPRYDSDAPIARFVGPIFLILDGFAGHFSDAVKEQCFYYGVVLIVIPPHTSDQVQPLDLVFLRSMSRNSIVFTPIAI
jgi:hypothetical protein